MSKFLETYGVAIFTLVLIAILIAFAGPLGLKIKEYTLEKAEQTEQIGCDEISTAVGKTDDSATGGTVRPAEPSEAVDQIYCIYYDDGEMTISQNEIEPEVGRTVVKKGFYSKPRYCTEEMTTVRFVGAVKPKSCYEWFGSSGVGCSNLKEVKNTENLYTNECTNMSYMFMNCGNLLTLDLSHFNTNKVVDMSYMFDSCYSLTSIKFGDDFNTSKVINMSKMFEICRALTSLDLSNFDTSNVTNMRSMFYLCSSLTNLDLSNFDTMNVATMSDMFLRCDSLEIKSIKVSQATYDKLITVSDLGISAIKFDIID